MSTANRVAGSDLSILDADVGGNDAELIKASLVYRFAHLHPVSDEDHAHHARANAFLEYVHARFRLDRHWLTRGIDQDFYRQYPDLREHIALAMVWLQSHGIDQIDDEQIFDLNIALRLSQLLRPSIIKWPIEPAAHRHWFANKSAANEWSDRYITGDIGSRYAC